MTRRQTWAIGWLVLALGVARAGELAIGARAPDFALQDLSGTTRRLADHRGQSKAIVVLWFSAECPICRHYESRVQALYDEFKGQSVTFYTINSNRSETVASIRERMHARSLTFPVLKDPGNKVADEYGAQATPEIFILDGQLKLRYHGASDNSEQADRVDPNKRYARRAIQALLAGRRPSPARVGGFGCAIDREPAAGRQASGCAAASARGRGAERGRGGDERPGDGAAEDRQPRGPRAGAQPPAAGQRRSRCHPAGRLVHAVLLAPGGIAPVLANAGGARRTNNHYLDI